MNSVVDECEADVKFWRKEVKLGEMNLKMSWEGVEEPVGVNWKGEREKGGTKSTGQPQKKPSNFEQGPS